ncbi:Octanoyltransferase [Candidatus Zixiibacteriota bacterium]|nr:Octanoyltransferase [candidate division Zixibacteria bacterium]
MCSRGFKRLFRINLGRTNFPETWALQKRLVNLRYRSLIPDCLIFTEHNPVITMGRGTSRKNLLVALETLTTKGIELFEIERGGDITFHGPGQTVVYPILDLTARGRDLHQYLRDLEKLMIITLQDLGLKAEIKPGLTGVWVNNHKLAAIGVAVSKWVSYHGLALNISTDLNYFNYINPCGITEYPVGTLEQMAGRKIEADIVNDLIAKNFAELFYYEMEAVENLERQILEIKIS